MVKSIHHWESHCRLLTLPPPLLETNSSVPRVSLALMASPPALPHCPGTHLLKQEPLLGGDPMLLPSQHLSRSVLLGREPGIPFSAPITVLGCLVFVLPGFLSSVLLTIATHRMSPCLVRCPVPLASRRHRWTGNCWSGLAFKKLSVY